MLVEITRCERFQTSFTLAMYGNNALRANLKKSLASIRMDFLQSFPTENDVLQVTLNTSCQVTVKELEEAITLIEILIN